MTFKEAMDVVMTFGQYVGQTIHEIGSEDYGLNYLDWLMGQKWFKRKDEYEAVKTYLESPGVSSRLND